MLKKYLAYFKLQKIKTKVLVIVFHSLAQKKSKLKEDLRKKYLADILTEEDIKIMTMEEVCQGMNSFELHSNQNYTKCEMLAQNAFSCAKLQALAQMIKRMKLIKV